MITKNFKLMLAAILLSNSTDQNGKIAGAKTQNGTNVFLSTFFNANQFPVVVTSKVVKDTSSAGIQIGIGSTPANENDYALESLITSGFSASTPTITKTVDSSGNVSLDYTFTITNTDSADLTIREIGYVQDKQAGTSSGGSASTVNHLLLDRTVLDTPIVIPAGEYAAIKYSIKVNMTE